MGSSSRASKGEKEEVKKKMDGDSLISWNTNLAALITLQQDLRVIL